MTRSVLVLGLCAVPLALLGGCSKKDDGTILPSASALAPSVAAPSAKVVKYTIAATGKTSIDMPAPNERIKADTTSAGGSIDVDLMNLANTRGDVKIDVADLTTHTWDKPDKAEDNAAQTKHARVWLEVSDQVTPEMKEKNRWVVFAIRSIDGLSASDLTKVAPTKEGAEDVRTVTMMAHGDFLLHQREAKNKPASLEVKFHYPTGAAADSKPTSIEIKSKDPLKVTLNDHDVKPRDKAGKIAAEGFKLLGTKVADVASISLELKATPAS